VPIIFDREFAQLDKRRARLRRQEIACGVLAFALASLVGLSPLVAAYFLAR
jgi:hypothetical protein